MTIRSLFLPLDGSDLAENALPAAAYFAQLYGASLTLFHVIEKGVTDRIHASHHLTRPAEAEAYLQEVAARYLPAAVTVDCHVHKTAIRNVAASIVEHSQEYDPDLILLCAHGSGGTRDWLIGNIAQQVISRGSKPVLLLRPSRAPASGASFSIRSILLPLDGLPEHERSTSLGEDIAGRCGASLHLARVVPTPETLAGESAAAGRLLPGSTAALLDLTEREAHDYLDRHRQRLLAAGLKTTIQVLRGDPADELARLVHTRMDDLIVLGTHGKSGASAFWNRSVAARVLGKIKIPALLIPIR
jgi:nucleotide-binding universal stress UspA family protein